MNLKYDTASVCDGAIWKNSDYQSITITKDTPVSPVFYNWFMSNAKKVPKLSSVLNDNSWEDIKTAADLGIGQNYWSVGDTKEVTLNGSVGITNQATFTNQTYWVYIIGFDHNSAKEGTGIAFQGFKTAQTGGIDIAVVATNYGSSGSGMVMNTTQTNSGGWAGSAAYKTIMPQWKACFPSDLQAVIKTTTLYTDDVGSNSTAAANVKASSNEVYYLAEYEVFGVSSYANSNEAAQQQQYAYYKAGNSKIKYRSDSTGTTAYWWLRSACSSRGSGFCNVYTDGSAFYSNAYYSYGAAPAFKVGTATGGVTPDPEPSIPLSGDLAVGNLVTFDDKSWRVVHNDGSKWYLASENIVENTAFGNDSIYAGSTVASKCVSYLTNFSDSAKKYMVDVTVADVTGKVFLPTYLQVYANVANGGFEYYITQANRIAKYNGTVNYWWLSCTEYDSDTTSARAVMSNGSYSNFTPVYPDIGFRPHICIDTSF